MSHRAGNGSLTTSSHTISSNGALGILAENIPSSGTNGAGYAYPSLSFPTDNGKEIRGEITVDAHVISGAGVLTSFFAYEDTSFDLVVTDDCIIEWIWDLYVDGVLDTVGLVATVTIGGSGITITPDSVNSASVSNDPSIDFNSVVSVSPLSIDSSSLALDPTISFASAVNVTPNTIDSLSESLDPTVLFSGSVNITPQTIDSVSVSNNPVINFASLLQVSPQSIDSISTSNDPTISFTSSLNISPQAIDSLSQSIDPLIEFKSVINLLPSSIDSLSISLNPIITTGEVQNIGNVTAGFADDLYSVKYKLSGITVNFK